MTISFLPTPPSRNDSPDAFISKADAFIASLPTFVSETNTTAAAMNLNATTVTSTTSRVIGIASKTFTVASGKSFIGGMWVSASSAASPSTNQMVGIVTSYSGTSLVVDVKYILGSGTYADWIIAQSAPSANYASPSFANATVTASSGDALTVTNTGTGNCLVVNDAAGDTKPLVIDAGGRIIQGHSRAISLEQNAYVQNHSPTGQAQFRWVNDANGTYTSYVRSRSPTIGSFSPLTVNDVISYHRFYGDDGVAFVESARVMVSVDATVSTGVMPGRYLISTVSATGVMTEALRIDSSQRTLMKAAHAVSATFANPISGATVTLTNSTSHYQRIGTGTIAALTINLPENPVHGQVVSFGSRGVITALTVGSAGTDTIADAPTTLAAGGNFEMIYNTYTTTWFRKG